MKECFDAGFDDVVFAGVIRIRHPDMPRKVFRHLGDNRANMVDVASVIDVDVASVVVVVVGCRGAYPERNLHTIWLQ